MEASKKGERFTFSFDRDFISAYLPSATVGKKTYKQDEYRLIVREDDLFVQVGDEGIRLGKWFGNDTESN